MKELRFPNPISMRRINEEIVVNEEEKTGCWYSASHSPRAKTPYIWNGTTVVSVKRFLWVYVFERELSDTDRLIAQCGNPSCVNPDHMKVIPKKTRW